MNDILIWGSGSIYDEMITLIKYYENNGQFRVVGITSDDCYYDNIDEYPFIAKKYLGHIAFDWVFICVRDEISVRKEAVLLGIEENKLLSVRILLLPYFDFTKYATLVKSRISIFANNCWGGLCIIDWD